MWSTPLTESRDILFAKGGCVKHFLELKMIKYGSKNTVNKT